MGDDDGIEKRKRILPPWMMGVAVADHMGNDSKDVNNNDNNYNLNAEPNVVQNCGENIAKYKGRKTKIRRRKGSDPPSSIDGDGDMFVGVNKEAEEDENAKNVGCSTYERGEVEVDEDEDLTVDDLLSIAKEFMRIHGDLRSASQPPSPGRAESGGGATTYASMKTATTANDGRKGTEDPARDMLELFIGPLLKKPTEEDDKALSQIMCESVPRDSQLPWKIYAGEKEKKKNKSSLRDKVTALLE